MTTENTPDPLADISVVATFGDVRRVICQMILDLRNNKVSAADVTAAAKAADAASNTLNTEIKAHRAAIELRDRGSNLGKMVELGQMIVGSPKK